MRLRVWEEDKRQWENWHLKQVDVLHDENLREVMERVGLEPAAIRHATHYVEINGQSFAVKVKR